MWEKLYLKLKTTKGFRGRLAREPLDISANNFIPKIIYIYWDTGESAAPDLCRYCIESWRRYNPNWKVVVLDQAKANQYIDINTFGFAITQAAYSDMLRVTLLAKTGGVWVDSTVVCHRSLDDWLPMVTMSVGFFAFSRPGRDRILSSWFLAAAEEHYLMKAWQRTSFAYLASCAQAPSVYFWFHYLFELEVVRNKKFRKLWAKVPKITANLGHYFQSRYNTHKPNDIDIIVTAPLQKLCHKAGYKMNDYKNFTSQGTVYEQGNLK